MSMKIVWVGRDQAERVGEIRWRCYGNKESERAAFIARTIAGRWVDGDVAIATVDGVDVGTATSLSLSMRLRGRDIDTQGVAWVGTAKSFRRRRVDGTGVASAVMRALAEKATERGQAASALMPFRGSYYEHFGYGIVESQHIWTIPLSAINAAPTGNFVFGSSDNINREAMLACRERQYSAGRCDIRTSPDALGEWFSHLTPNTQLFADVGEGGRVRSYAWVRSVIEGEKQVAEAVQPAWESSEALADLLRFFGTLRDQYSAVRLALPTDCPVNWMLSEVQVPHRRVDHPAAACSFNTRMQIRVVEPVAFWTGQSLPKPSAGSVVVTTTDLDGRVEPVTFRLTIEAGLLSAKPAEGPADVTTDTAVWAAIAGGGLSASAARAAGRLGSDVPQAVELLDALAVGPAPFCHEYF